MRDHLRLYGRFLRAHLAEHLQYRIAIWLWMVWWIVQLFAYMMVWSAVAGARGVAGFQRADFVAYYLVLMVVGRLTRSIDMWQLEVEIRLGRLTPKLLWPVDRIHESLTRWLSSSLLNLAVLAPLIPLLAVVLEPRIALTLERVLLAGPALLVGMGVGFLWGHVVALAAFWTVRTMALYRLYILAGQLLGGVVAPLAILPAGLGSLSRLLPFYYTHGFAVEAFLGHLEAQTYLQLLPVGLAWLLCGLVVRQLVWRAGLRRYTAVGA